MGDLGKIRIPYVGHVELVLNFQRIDMFRW